MRTLTLSLLLALAGFACAADTGVDQDLDSNPGLGIAIQTSKADGAFGSRDISLGDTVQGETSGEGIVLFAIELDAGDEFTVDISRLSGDLRPSAYLYEGTTVFVGPESYNASSDAVTLNYRASAAGQHHIIAQAYRGMGAGTFELTTTCTAGPCATGSTLIGLERADQCIVRATDCAFAELPSYNGRVGVAAAQRILDECLLAQGADCVDACSAAPEAQGACDYVTSELPTFADQSMECLVTFTYCLDECQGMNPYGYSSDPDQLASVACWSGLGGSDYYGNCIAYAGNHTACGGFEYSSGTFAECNARCENTEGAFDEGPFDGCLDGCSDLADEEDAFIREVAADAGEYVTVDDDASFAQIEISDVPQGVIYIVEYQVDTYNEEAVDDGRADFATINEENLLSISKDGSVIGYMIDVDYHIDDPIYDGGGVHLYMNASAEILETVEWSG